MAGLIQTGCILLRTAIRHIDNRDTGTQSKDCTGRWLPASLAARPQKAWHLLAPSSQPSSPQGKKQISVAQASPPVALRARAHTHTPVCLWHCARARARTHTHTHTHTHTPDPNLSSALTFGLYAWPSFSVSPSRPQHAWG